MQYTSFYAGDTTDALICDSGWLAQFEGQICRFRGPEIVTGTS